ncbi:alpha/beta fold hydrolase [Nocardioides sp.]|uniref:alpha/beta fold hydrolase n=1 Tax=Nocardioides sp. TaxID=35761 RepID=UPI0027354D8D|nr:alpha/beta fold hydrolase [Nocardioides sp.]MDP3893820.1 alpha/beta fold hydrolase [Nocardioides sp.]
MSDLPATDLHVTHLGDHGSRVLFFHGLFGQGRNWTQIAKEVAADHRVTLVDLPNHGRSAWTEQMDYLDVADRLAALIDADDPAVVVGHSMGGKAAMALALRHPTLVERLAVVDVSPVSYAHGSEFVGFVEAMRAIDLTTLESRADADARLAPAVENSTVRGFLLQNLRRDGDGWRWQVNLEGIRDGLTQVGGWPAADLADVAPYDGPVLWVAGERSDYVADDYSEAMERWFPRARRVTVKGAGHWVHSEQPDVFVAILHRFLA